MTQVGVGEIPILPTFKGFRRLVESESTSSGKSAAAKLAVGFSSAGETAGKGFSASFNKSASQVSTAALRQATEEVAKASREVSKVRLQELDANGKVRVAEAQLADARRRYSSDSAQVVRAEERLSTVQRQQKATTENLSEATKRLSDARDELADVSSAGSGQTGSWFQRLTAGFSSAGESAGTRFSSGFRTNVGAIFTGSLLANFAASAIRSVADTAVQAVQTGVDYAFQGITLASEAEQNFGAVESVFKEYADSVVANSQKASTAVGLSRSKYSQFAVVVGAQLKNLGVNTDEVAGRTNDLITLGADLAAQFGGPTSDAVSAISSLLRGERDPIERYGVGLKEIDISARLAAKGQSELTGEAEKQARIAATLELLWEQTASAQGTFSAESETAAGRLQILTAQWEDVQTKFGESLLPIATEGLGFVTSDLLPVISAALDDAGPQLADSLRQSMPEIERIVSGLATLLPAAIDLGTDVTKQAADIVDTWAKVYEARERYESGPEVDFWDINSQIEKLALYWDMFDGRADYAENIWAETVFGMRYETDELEAHWATSLLGMKASADAIEMQSSGAAFAAGFADGIETSSELAVRAAERMALRSRDKAANVMQIQSPSRVMRRLGQFVGEGFALGIEDKGARAEQAMSGLAQTSFAGVAASGPGAGSGPAQAVDRPIYADGSLFGWIRELANGEARLVVAESAAHVARGWRRD